MRILFKKYKYSEGLDNLGISRIGIQRTACRGSCPVYTMIVESNGNVFYQGHYGTEKLSKHVGRLYPYHIFSIFEYIDKYFYTPGVFYFSYETSSSTTLTLATKNGVDRVINNYSNSGPILLWSIETHIDSLYDKVIWK